MPRFDNERPISKGAAHAVIAKALRAYFDGEQVEVVDIDIKSLDVDITIWCDDHGESSSDRDTTFKVRRTTDEEREAAGPHMVALMERLFGDE